MKLHAEVALGGFKLRWLEDGLSKVGRRRRAPYAIYYCISAVAGVSTEARYNPVAALEQARRYLLQPDESAALPGAAKALPPR